MADFEDRYRELQAEFTRKSQELAELRRKIESGELVEANAFTEKLRQWAQENPDDALSWLGLQLPDSGSGEHEAARDGGELPSVLDFDGIDPNDIPDDVFDPESELSKEITRRYGEEGLRRIMRMKYGQELLESSPLGHAVRSLEERLASIEEQMQERLSQVEQRVDGVRKYAEAAWGEIVAAKDPRVEAVRTLQDELKQDQSKWLDLAEAWKAYRAQKAQQGTAEGQGTGGAEAQNLSGSAPADSVAARQSMAQASSEGVGPSSPGVPGGASDPWEMAVQLAKREREGAV